VFLSCSRREAQYGGFANSALAKGEKRKTFAMNVSGWGTEEKTRLESTGITGYHVFAFETRGGGGGGGCGKEKGEEGGGKRVVENRIPASHRSPGSDHMDCSKQKGALDNQFVGNRRERGLPVRPSRGGPDSNTRKEILPTRSH